MSNNHKDVLAEVNASTVHNVNGVPVVLAPEGYDIHQFTERLTAPLRFQRTITAQTVESLIAYAHAHADKNGFASAIFHDIDRSRFTLVVDNDVTNPTDELTAAWGEHRAVYSPETSKEFAAWQRLDGKWIGQQDLAEFFEDREDDFAAPTGAEIFELVTNLNLKRNVNVASAVNLNNGTFAIQYAEEKASGSVELPEDLVLGLAPFKNGDRYEVKAKLRYRVKDGTVLFQVKLRNPEKVVEAAFNDIVAKLTNELPDVQHFTASAW